jgi:hypothetical protein
MVARLAGRLPAALVAPPSDLPGGATALAAARRHSDGALVVYAGGASGVLNVWTAAAADGDATSLSFRRARTARLASAPLTALALLRGRSAATLPLALVGAADGRLLAYSGDAGATAGGRPAHAGGALTALAVGGAAVVSGGADGAVRVWSLAEGRHPWAKAAPPPTAELAAGGGASITCVAASPDGASVAAGGDDGGVRVWDVRARADAPALVLPAGDDRVAGVGCGGGGGLAVACGSTLTLFDGATAASSTVIPAALRCAAVSGHVVAAGTEEGVVAAWRAGGDGDAALLPVRPGAGVAAVAMVGGGEGGDDALVSAHDDGGVVVVVG